MFLLRKANFENSFRKLLLFLTESFQSTFNISLIQIQTQFPQSKDHLPFIIVVCVRCYHHFYHLHHHHFSVVNDILKLSFELLNFSFLNYFSCFLTISLVHSICSHQFYYLTFYFIC